MRPRVVYERIQKLRSPNRRFYQMEFLCETNMNWTLYNYCNNNPLAFNDPLGLDTIGVAGKTNLRLLYNTPPTGQYR